MKKNKGFTLFELLVSISIIAVMTAVAVVSFGGVSKRSRDARRMADLEKIRLALESAKQIGTTYPTSLTTLVGGSMLQQVPTDPKNYTYYFNGSAYAYTLCAQMEDVASTNTPGASGCGAGACGTGGNCNYKVINP